MPTDRPNVVLIMQDQLRYDAVHDPDLCRTPTQDDLRARGATFTQHYAPLGICSPSRASLLTGRYPHSHGVLNNLNGTDAFVEQLPRHNATVAELLADVGYRTGYFGKWHLGRDHGPGTRGFADVGSTDQDLVGERFEGYWSRFSEPTPDAVMTRYPEPVARHADRYPRRPFPIYSTETVPEEITFPRAITDEAQELIHGYSDGEEPFFLFVSYLAPHWPNVLPEPYASMYDPADMTPWPNFDDDFSGKPRTLQAGLEHFGVTDFTWDDWAPIVARYLGAVSFVDDLVGRLLSTLQEAGLADDTLVMATADHGDMTGAHRQFNKGPLMYEEVYRIPMLVRWPGVVEAGTSVDALTSHVDVTPTLLDAAGLDPHDQVEGASLLQLVGDGDIEWRKSLMCEFHGDEFGLYSQRMLRRGRYKLIYNPNDVNELYDLDADPHELDNLADDPEHEDLRRDLEADLLEQMYELEDPLRMWAVNTLG